MKKLGEEKSKKKETDNCEIRTHALSDCDTQIERPEHSALDRSAKLPGYDLMLLEGHSSAYVHLAKTYSSAFRPVFT